MELSLSKKIECCFLSATERLKLNIDSISDAQFEELSQILDGCESRDFPRVLCLLLLRLEQFKNRRDLIVSIVRCIGALEYRLSSLRREQAASGSTPSSTLLTDEQIGLLILYFETGVTWECFKGVKIERKEIVEQLKKNQADQYR